MSYKIEDIIIAIIIFLVFFSATIFISVNITACGFNQNIINTCTAFCHPEEFTHNTIDGCVCDN